MPSEQYRTGNVAVVNGSQTIIGTDTNFSANVSAGQVFKVDLDGEATYSIGAVLTATRMQVSANYLGSTHAGMDYMVCRSFTPNRNYWRVLQGDSDFAELLSQETIDKIDTDVGNILSGAATIDGTRATSFGIRTGSFTARITATGLTASREYTLPDANTTIGGLGVNNTWTGKQTFSGNSNALHSLKRTITTADLTANAASQSVKIFRASAGDLINEMIGNIATPLKFGATATVMRVKAGDAGDEDGFAKAHLCGSSEPTGFFWEGQGAEDKGEYLYNASGNRVNKFYTTATDIYAKVVASDCMVSSLTQGSVDFYLSVMRFE